MNTQFRRVLTVSAAFAVVVACVAFAHARATDAGNANPSRRAPTLQDAFDRAYRGYTPASVTTSRARAPRFAQRWRVALPVDVVGLPAADARGVVVTAGEAEVVALSLGGDVQWTTPVSGALVNAPRLEGDRVFVAAKRAIVALDRTTGAVVWTSPTAADGGADERANEPVVVGDTVVATSESGRAYGIGRADGALRWTVQLATATTAEPAAGANVVVVVGVGQWWALNPQTGDTVWSGDIGTYGTSSPVLYTDGNRAVAALATDGEVVAVDAGTGEILWHRGAEQAEYFQVPTVTADHQLLVPDHWGRLEAFNAHDGTPLWKVHGADAVAEFGEPAVLGPELVAIALDDGGPRIGSPSGSRSLKIPAAGHGVAMAPGGLLVVTTWDAAMNYVVGYAVDAG
ncbi:MAG: hypothetical protein QOJ00_866 [Actinomycetota bacterium]